MARKEKPEILIHRDAILQVRKDIEIHEKQHSEFLRRISRLSEEFKDQVLSVIEYDEAWESRFSSPTFYRVCNPQDGVFSTTGSLKDGGRCNIGGAQEGDIPSQKYGPLANPQGAIYVSDSADAAIAEAIGAEYGPIERLRDIVKRSANKQLYRVTLHDESEPICLIELDPIFQQLRATYRIDDFFSETLDMNGGWRNLKTPAPIQLFTAWLYQSSNGAAGIRFRSTQSSEKFNVALYYRNAQAAQKVLKAEKITP
ncbi:RES domain-containing protein [Pseudobacteriovorax antillogorgiicola]|uniref:RES domain-containing protein n=1 Tax=Pseudobacteriovorax antillogorgiicola TaxID=1513793 RepID=A0A1Y6CFI8_9BACT|nr:RES domain-containing protein [Pseudobacteriovorax antillogorgiicola]TCS47562.1 RES domain-containing protein [Pseudobacteriovorax antillogorgiicola]SMF60532.1 RES domain-containing protein [Pseudobacteriovorax antillogorgiicola]